MKRPDMKRSNIKRPKRKDHELEQEFRQILSAYKTSDEDTTAQIQEALVRLGPDKFDQLRALTERVARQGRFAVATAFVVVPLSLVLGLAFRAIGWLPDNALTFLSGLCFVGFFGALMAQILQEYRLKRLSEVLVAYNDPYALSTLAMAASINPFGDEARKAIPKTLSRIEPASLQALEPQGVRHLHKIVSRNMYSDVRVQVMRALLPIKDAGVLTTARRLLEARDFELREAAQDYLDRWGNISARLRSKDSVPAVPETEVGIETVGTTNALGNLENDVIALVRRLGSRDVAVRNAAEQAISKLEGEAFERLLELLGSKTSSRKNADRIIVTGCIVLGSLLGPLLLIGLLALIPFVDFSIVVRTSVATAFAFAAGGWIIGHEVTYNSRERERARMFGWKVGVFPWRRICEALSKIDNPAVIGVLAEATAQPGEVIVDPSTVELTRALTNALIRTLPSLKATDAGLLNVRQRAILNSRLKLESGPNRGSNRSYYDGVALCEAILKAWEQVGDAEALPYVQKLATIAPRGPETRRLREAACACLPFLEARAQQEIAGKQLLRAASASAFPGEHLLRPAAEDRPVNDGAELLRPQETIVH